MSESLEQALETANRTRAEVRQQLATAPVRELNGLVATTGLTAARFGNEKRWTVEVVLTGWHEQGGSIQPALMLETLASDEQVALLKEQLLADTVVSLRVRMPSSSGAQAPERALLEEVHGSVTDDARLNELLLRSKEPKSIYFETIGAVSLDSAAGLYESVTLWRGREVRLVLPVEAEHELNAAARNAQRLLSARDDWHARVLLLVAQKMVPLKNEAWRDEGEPEVTGPQLCAGITLTSVWVDADGSFDFWFDGGDHFWGHDIHVSGTLEGGPTEVILVG